MAKEAATPKEAAQIYPANYWYSLLEVPGATSEIVRFQIRPDLLASQ